MANDNDKILMKLFTELSEKTTALLHHLKSRDIERDMISDMEKDLKKLQQQIRERSDYLRNSEE